MTEDNWFDSNDVKDIPDIFYELEDCFSVDDIASIPPVLSPLLKMKIELEKFAAWAKAA